MRFCRVLYFKNQSGRPLYSDVLERGRKRATITMEIKTFELRLKRREVQFTETDKDCRFIGFNETLRKAVRQVFRTHSRLYFYLEYNNI